MTEERRPVLAPHGTFDRVLYAMIAVLFPWTIPNMYRITKGDDSALVIFTLWWVVCTFYTIRWIRSWFSRV